MLIKDLIPVPKTVKFGKKEAKVAGLALEDVVLVLEKHKDALSASFAGDKPDFLKLAKTSPDLVAEVICLSLGSVGQEADAKKLPMHMQVEILIAIWEETVPDLKKITELLSGVMGQLKESGKPEPQALTK